MDLTTIIAMISSVAAVIGANIALFTFLKSDMNKLETNLKSDLKSFESEIRGWKEEIYREMRDFHGKLYALNERISPRTDP